MSCTFSRHIINVTQGLHLASEAFFCGKDGSAGGIGTTETSKQVLLDSQKLQRLTVRQLWGLERMT